MRVLRGSACSLYAAFFGCVLVASCGGHTSQPSGASGGPDASTSADSADVADAEADAGADATTDAERGTAEVDADSADASDAADSKPTKTCLEAQPAIQPEGQLVTFQTDPYLDGAPLIFGEPNALPGGGTLTPLDFRYYISEVTLKSGDGRLTRVDLVSADGEVEPYGVHFFNAEDAPSTAWSIRAPAGTYTGLVLTLGLDDVCNAFDEGRKAPLDVNSQMTWPPPFNYLFLRFEANVAGASVDRQGQPWLSAIAMGGLQGSLFAPVVHVAGQVKVPARGEVTRHLRVDMEQLFNGANTAAALPTALVSIPETPGVVDSSEGGAGERLRQSAPNLPLFILDP